MKGDRAIRRQVLKALSRAILIAIPRTGRENEMSAEGSGLALSRAGRK